MGNQVEVDKPLTLFKSITNLQNFLIRPRKLPSKSITLKVPTFLQHFYQSSQTPTRRNDEINTRLRGTTDHEKRHGVVCIIKILGLRLRFILGLRF